MPLDPAQIELAERIAADSRRHFAVVADGLRGEVRQVAEQAERIAGENRRQVEAVAAELRGEMRSVAEKSDQVATETRRHFEVIAEGLRSDVRLVAEGVAGLDQRLSAFQTEVKEEFSEVRSMIHLSYSQLDRRLRILESAGGATGETPPG